MKIKKMIEESASVCLLLAQQPKKDYAVIFKNIENGRVRSAMVS